MEGLVGKPTTPSSDDLVIPPEADEAMRKGALVSLSARIARTGKSLPVIVGKDRDLPKAPPVFDLDEMRRRNSETKTKKRTK